MAPPECTCAHLSGVKNVNNSSILQPRNSAARLRDSGGTFLLGNFSFAVIAFLSGTQSVLHGRLRQAALQQRRQLQLFCIARSDISPPGNEGMPPSSAKCAEGQSFLLHLQLSLFSHSVHLTFPFQYTQLRSVKRYIPLGHRKDKCCPFLIPS